MNAVLVCGLVCLFLCTSVVAIKYDVKDGHHNLSIGHRRAFPLYPEDILLFHENPSMESSFLRVKSEDVCYPPKGSNNNKRFTITAFNVTDLMPQGEGGYAFVTDGGVGSDKLCLHLKTQRGNGYNFNVDIWGYYNIRKLY